MPSKGTSTRERVLVSAGELLQRQGYFGTGLAQVLEQADAPKGSLYFHFPDGKEQLVAESITRSGEAIAELIESLLESTTDPVEALAECVRLYERNLTRSEYELGCPIATVTLETAATSQPIQVACRDAYAKWLELLEQRLAKEGFPDQDAKSGAAFILSSIEGALLLARAAHDTAALTAVAQHLGAWLAGEVNRYAAAG